MKDIFTFIDSHHIEPVVGAVYPFQNLADALYDMDNHKVDGKIVVKM